MSPSSPQAATAAESEPSASQSAAESAFRLKLLGSWDLTARDGHRVQSVLSQPKRMCLLAYLALTAEPVSRSTVVALFWPETDEDHARNALSQSLHYLRRSMGKGIVDNVEGDRIMVRADFVDFDARTLLALDAAAGDKELSVATDPSISQGDFFEGWNADGSLPLQDWLDATRLRVRRAQERIEARAEQPRSPAHVEQEGPTSPPLESDRSAATRDRGAGAPRWVLPLGIGILAAAALVLWWTALAGSERQGAMESTPVAVLMPALVGTGMVDEAALPAIHAEIINRLRSVVEAQDQLLSVSFARSANELERILDAQSEVPIPHQVIEVLIRANGSSTRVNASLLAGTGYVVVVETASGDYTLETEADAILRLPGEVADLLADEFGEELVRR